MKLSRFAMIGLLLAISVFVAQSAQAALFAPPAPNGAVGIQARTANVAPAQAAKAQLLPVPPVLSPEQAAWIEEVRESHPLPMPPLPEGKTAVQRLDSNPDPSTATNPPSLLSGQSPQSPTAPGDFTVFRNSTMGSTINSQTSRTTEPTFANSGHIVFGTGNWYAALSTDGGQTFSYLNPYTTFPASFGGFCCDQIVVYDPSRDIFLWFLQYVSSGPAGSGQNIFRLAAARPQDAAAGNWWYYDFISAINTEWDYPDMCLSNDYVWITTNRGPYAGTFVNDAWMFKMPLDPISAGAAFSYSFLDLGSVPLSNLSLRCTRGAWETMYFGSHNTLSQVRIFRWAEDSGTIFWDDVNLSAAWFNPTHSCPGPDGRNWCGFDDGRIKAGWVSRDRIGFLWGSAQGGGFTWPYVEAVRVRESDRAYLDRPYVWSSGIAYAYPAAAPNARGDVGVGLFYGSGSIHPSFAVGVDDDFSRAAGYTPPPWYLGYGVSGTTGPNVNRWGDYISVQPFAPTSLGWTAAGFTLQGTGGSGSSVPRYVIFGRERDLRSVTRYYNNPVFGAYLPVILKQ